MAQLVQPIDEADERLILESWTPEPLVPDVDLKANKHVLEPRIVSSRPGKYITVDGCRCLNLGTHNYLGLADSPRLEEASIKAVRKYGVGSCGPRAFYGTMDVHLELEKELASFLQVQDAVLYSFGFSTLASAIPAYAKASDYIFVDEHCNLAILQGLLASKSRVIKFEHNNTEDLEQKIQDLKGEQIEKYGKTKLVRTFLIVEGIYARNGDLCPLNELIEIKKRHKIRLFVDESKSFGVLGKEGRGITEHFNADINDIDVIMASLENAMCAFGGFCAGSTKVIDHQRLAGSGYCFSASLPPLQTQVALESLKIIREDPSLVRGAQEIFAYANEEFHSLSCLDNISHPLSPIKVLVLKEQLSDNYEDDAKGLRALCEQLLVNEQIAITVAEYITSEEMTCPRASIRVVINGSLDCDDLDRLVKSIEKFSIFEH